MKKLVGNFRTEEEAILAINDLKAMGLNANEITIMTLNPVEFLRIESTLGQGGPSMVVVGDVIYGAGAESFLMNLAYYGFTTEKAKLYHDSLGRGSILVFIGVNDEVHHHMDNPGSYRAKELHIDDIETPGSYTLSPERQATMDSPGTYQDPHTEDEILTPGTFQNPLQHDEILNPGTFSGEDQVRSHPNMIVNPKSTDNKKE